MTIIVTGYKSKKELKEAIGQKLQYRETSFFGIEFKADGKFAVAHRPSIAQIGHEHGGKEFFAEVNMIDGLIYKVI